MKTFQDLYPYSFNGLQTVEGQNYSFSVASKGCKRYQTMNKGLIAKRFVIKRHLQRIYSPLKL